MENNTTNKNTFVCIKCGNQNYTTDKITTTSGVATKIFGLQNKKFITVSCSNCGYTELFKTTTSGLENAADLLLGK